MQIINLTDFLNLPEGTLYTPWEPNVAGELRIKGDSSPPDFYFQSVVETFEVGRGRLEEGSFLCLDLNCQQRDGMFEDKQLFAVWSTEEVHELIGALLIANRRPCSDCGIELNYDQKCPCGGWPKD